ncbi:MAG TPA: hypothetical protein VMX94_03025 [Armatimonadota bacterium]|nr:hypothetical protein [Armatimonadota bacterium]
MPSSCCPGADNKCCCVAGSSPDIASQTIIGLVTGKDPRAEGMMPGWAVEVARQKLLFLTAPAAFPARLKAVSDELCCLFQQEGIEVHTNCIAFLLGIADSLNSAVELQHNLQNSELHGEGTLSDADVATCYEKAANLVLACEKQSPDAARAALDSVKAEDLAVNKGDNLYIAWAKNWEVERGADPYSSVSEFLQCFKALYSPETYYVALFLAWKRGETRTQFFNDYGLHAARCRKIGSLGGTTNPAIAVMGEDDLDGKGNVHGEEATRFITSRPNKWREVRKVIAREQLQRGEQDDWAGTAFTEWVVVDAMLGLRSVFLLEGLGRVAFQLRPDWHCDEKKLAYAGGQIYEQLGRRMKVFDDILLEGAGEPYASIAAPRVGKPNNHFKISCTSQVALNIVRAFNAGRHPDYPDALKERMFTNMTLSYEVSQMTATWLALEQGLAEYERRTGEKVDDGKGGSVITSMIGRFNDAIRVYRVEHLLAALPEGSRFKAEIKPSAVKSLTDAPLNTDEFKAEVAKAGVEFDPEAEEDAIDRAGTLCTKRAVMHIQHKYGTDRTRILTASKRNFAQNTELLDVPFSTDFGNIQRAYLDLKMTGMLKVESWRTIYDGMNPDGTPVAGSIWDKRNRVLARIWPDWVKAFDPDGVRPEEYINAIYVPPTLNQFIGFWNENVARAKAAREAAERGG